MLSQLSIRDIVLIERLDLEFGPGLSVLTGETGAGKSILLDALSLALGSRGDASLVRNGATQGQVSAVFDVPRNHSARALLDANAFDHDGDIILRRVQTADGRTRVFVNDQPASVALMRDLGRHLVELHGQHDERALIDPVMHRELLDAFGGHGGEVAATADAHKLWRAAEQELSRHRAKVAAAAREADYLRASVSELEALDPQPGEEDELAELRARMMRAEKTAVEINDAVETLSGQSSAVPTLSGLLRRLQRKEADAPELLGPIIVALDNALIALDGAQEAAGLAERALDFDPRVLERAEERLFALRAAARKYSVTVEGLPALRDSMVADLADLDAGEGRLAALEKASVDTRAVFDRHAAHLSELRAGAAVGLAKAVMAELPALKLERAEFIVHHDRDETDRRAEGIDHIEFLVRTNPGTKA
ncbi:MAG: DNA repair protein RecN, partial [Mesorhizobium sp.]